MRILILIAAIAWASLPSAFAKIDLTPYRLTPSQIETIRKFEAKGYDDDFIRRLAEAMQKHNEQNRDPVYIPPHTPEDIRAVTDWAGIGPFYDLVQHTRYEFDLKRYQEDCPSWALFNFGRATGTQYLKADVLNKAINSAYALHRAYALDPSAGKTDFQTTFDRLADHYGARPYLSVREP